MTWRIPNPQSLFEPIRIALGDLSKYLDTKQLDNSAARVATDWNPAWIAPTLLNGWTYHGAPWTPPGYRKYPNGLVHIKGLVAGGTDGATIFTLPVGYRPAHNVLVSSTGGNQASRLNVDTAGNITKEPAFGASVAWFSLEVIFSLTH